MTKKIDIQESIARRLSGLVEGFGVSRREVSRRCGVDPTFVNAVAHGKSMPSVVMVVGLAREFGVSPTWLLTGEGAKWLESGELLPGPPMMAREPTPPAYAADVDPAAVYVDGQRVSREDAVVHRNLQVLLVAGEPYRSGLVRYVDALARTVEAEAGLIQPRDAPHHEGQHAPGVGQGSAGGRKQSA